MCEECRVSVKAIKLSDEQAAQLKALVGAFDSEFEDGAEPQEVWKVVRIAEDYDLIEEAARVKKMSVPEFIAFGAAEYADLYLNAYEAAMQDLAEQIKAGHHG